VHKINHHLVPAILLMNLSILGCAKSKRAVPNSLPPSTVSLSDPVKIPAVGQAPRELDQQVFVDEALVRLGGLPIEEKARLEIARQAWVQSRNSGDWLELCEAVTQASQRHDIVSEVEIRTTPKDKATIRYQTVGERSRNAIALTAPQLTRCKIEIPVGLYHIWSERIGQPTSDLQAQYAIVKPVVVIEIPEAHE
jgi:hypothetical protein